MNPLFEGRRIGVQSETVPLDLPGTFHEKQDRSWGSQLGGHILPDSVSTPHLTRVCPIPELGSLGPGGTPRVASQLRTFLPASYDNTSFADSCPRWCTGGASSRYHPTLSTRVPSAGTAATRSRIGASRGPWG